MPVTDRAFGRGVLRTAAEATNGVTDCLVMPGGGWRPLTEAPK
ncbi:hypothetical protein [Nocardiopsis synnemataformans]